MKTTEKILFNLVKMLEERKFLNKKNNKKNNKLLLNQDNNEKTFKIKSDYSDIYYYIMFIFTKLTTIKKIDGIDTFINMSKNNNRLFIVKTINLKTYKQFINFNDSEVFYDHELLINLIDHELQPKFEILSPSESQNFLSSYNTKKSEIAKILSIDPIVRYYNLKDNQIIRIIRPSITSCYTVSYRIVTKVSESLLFKK